MCRDVPLVLSCDSLSCPLTTQVEVRKNAMSIKTTMQKILFILRLRQQLISACCIYLKSIKNKKFLAIFYSIIKCSSQADNAQITAVCCSNFIFFVCRNWLHTCTRLKYIYLIQSVEKKSSSET